MATKDEELQDLKRQVVENLEKSRKRAIRSSIALIAMALITFLSLMYAWIQETQAEKARNEAVANATEAQRQMILADLNAKKAIEVQNEAERQQALAAEALKKCEDSKKKR